MTLLDSEGFGLSANFADYLSYGIFLYPPNIGGNPGTILTNGPLGDNYFSPNTSYPQTAVRMFVASAQTFFYGQRLLFVPTEAPNCIAFLDPNMVEQFHLSISATGSISVYRSGTLLGATAIGVISTSGWTYLEVGATISTTAGSVIVRVNGVQILSLSSVNTQYSTNSLVQAVSWGLPLAGYSGGVTTAAHIYFSDNTGPAPWNTFLGDVRVQAARPVANGTVAFTPTSTFVPNPIGTSSTAVEATGAIVYRQFTPTYGGVLTGIQLPLNSTMTGSIQIAVYSNAGGQPATLLATSAALTNPTAGTQIFPISGGPTLTAGTAYWVAINASASWYGDATISGTCPSFSQTLAYSAGFPTTATVSGTAGTSTLAYGVMIQGTQNWVNVAEMPPIPSMDYNAANTVGAQDLFVMAPIGSGLGSVYALNIKALMSKSDAGTRLAETVVESGSATITGPSISLSISAQQYHAIYQTDPNTGVQWTQNGVNSARLGYKISG